MQQPYSAADEWRVVKFLADKRNAMHTAIGKVPAGPEIVMEAIRFSADVDRRLPDWKPQAKPRQAWPAYWRDADERADDARQRLIDLSGGDDPAAVFGESVTAAEVETAEAIERVFKRAMVGDKVDRDWKILFGLAQGQTQRNVARSASVRPPRIIDRKQVQLGAIWRALEAKLPAPSFATGVVWREAA